MSENVKLSFCLVENSQQHAALLVSEVKQAVK